MKKSEEIRRKTWRMIAKNLIILAVLGVVAFIGTRAWFTTGTSTTASGIEVECSIPAGLEVLIKSPGSTVNESDVWSDASTIQLNATNYAFLQNLNMSQVTGDGKIFIAPYLVQQNGIAIVDAEDAWDASKITTTPNQDYLSFDLYMRTAAKGKTVVFKNDTYCGPENPNETFANEEGNRLNPNSVIGAVRVCAAGFASLNATSPNSTKLLWIPAPHVYYAYDRIWTALDGDTSTPSTQKFLLSDTGNTLGLATAIDTTSLELTNYYPDNRFNGTYNHNYWSYLNLTKTHGSIAYGDSATSNVTANTQKDYKLHKNVDIAVLNNSVTYSGTEYQVNKVRVNVWIEGEDPESRAAQVDGKFKFRLELDMVNNH